MFRSSFPEVFLGKGVLKICSKFTGKHPCRSVISVKLLCNFEVGLRHGYPPVNLHIFRAPLFKNTYGGLLQSVTNDDWVKPFPDKYFMLFKCLVCVCVFSARKPLVEIKWNIELKLVFFLSFCVF